MLHVFTGIIRFSTVRIFLSAHKPSACGNFAGNWYEISHFLKSIPLPHPAPAFAYYLSQIPPVPHSPSRVHGLSSPSALQPFSPCPGPTPWALFLLISQSAPVKRVRTRMTSSLIYWESICFHHLIKLKIQIAIPQRRSTWQEAGQFRPQVSGPGNAGKEEADPGEPVPSWRPLSALRMAGLKGQSLSEQWVVGKSMGCRAKQDRWDSDPHSSTP